jgi:TetR/AcrR family transcriptional repressor of nem operon
MSTSVSTADRILDIAQVLVAKGGYNGFSYADIAEAIGIRKASIHHHFPSKADLVASLVDRYRQQAEAGLNALRQGSADPAEQLRSYLGFWQNCITDASLPVCVCAMLAGEMPMLPDGVAARVQGHFQSLAAWLASVLQAGAEQGLLRLDQDPEEEAQMLMASVHGAMLSARALGDPALFGRILLPQVERLLAKRQ